MDSTHVKAKIDTFKLQSDPDEVADKDARYGYKNKDKPFFGYKAHASIHANSEMITKLETMPGNFYDGEVFRKVVDTKADHGNCRQGV